jgi:hypothetical protein
MRTKRNGFWVVMLIMVLFLGIVIVGCVTSTPIPPKASPEQIEQINARNIAATTTNTATLAGFQIVSLIVSILLTLLSL